MRIENQIELTASKASQVCVRCKKNKKGCDKTLPSCGQCAKKSVTCLYEQERELDYQEEIRELKARLQVIERLLPTWALERNLDPSPSPILPWSLDSKAPALLLASLSRLYSSDSSSIQSSRYASTSIPMHSLIYRVIQAGGENANDIISRYFKWVHRWLPIVSKKLFYSRLENEPESADIAMLVLCMGLISRHPSSNPQEDQSQDRFYRATKHVFTNMQAINPTSTTLIQAALLIATYERGHGLLDAAYLSIGTCARMAFAARLPEIKPFRDMKGAASAFQIEEARNLWWGIVLCDRNIGSETSIRGRPLATGGINADDLIPLDKDELDADTIADSSSELRPTVSATQTAGIGMFGREAQAAFLHQEVVILMGKLDQAEHIEISELDSRLQCFLGIVLSDLAANTGANCCATAVTFKFVPLKDILTYFVEDMLIKSRALFILHKEILASHRRDAGFDDLVKRSKEALKTVVKISIDIARAVNSMTPTLDCDLTSPSFSYFTQTAEFCFEMARKDDMQWLYDINELEATMNFVSQRWRLAGNILDEINHLVHARVHELDVD